MIPYNEIARAKGWSPRGWFGLSEPQQVAVIRARSLGADGAPSKDAIDDIIASQQTQMNNLNIMVWALFGYGIYETLK